MSRDGQRGRHAGAGGGRVAAREIGHAIHEAGLVVDPSFTDRLERAYAEAKSADPFGSERRNGCCL